MIGNRTTLDANILIYSIDRDAGEKQQTAASLIEVLAGKDCVLTLQALSEFYFAATRKGKVAVKDAAEIVADWQTLFPTVTALPQTLNRAITATRRYQLSFWDAMLWAVAKENATAILYSEDFQHNQNIEGVTIVNPFIVEEL